MKWIVIRTYGNGKHMNKVYPMWFEWLSQAEKICNELNSMEKEDETSDKWIAIPLTQYIGSTW